jgi:hypothetical protein
LIVREAHALVAELFAKHPVLLDEVVDDLGLLAVDPAGEQNQQEAQERKGCSGSGMEGAADGSRGARELALLAPPGLPAPFTAKPGLVVVPTNEHFQIVRAEAKELGKVHERHRMVSAMQAAAAKCDLAHEEMVRLAEFRLQLERDLEAYLAQVVTRGGHRSKSLRSTLLPLGSRGTSRAPTSYWYQLLAAIPPAVFHAYLEGVRDRRRLPTNRGAQAFAVQRGPRREDQASCQRPAPAARGSWLAATLDGATQSD